MRRPHQFRFQEFHNWLTSNYSPCRVADIGGGKGVLAYMLKSSGWDVTVIDPVWQPVNWKFRHPATGARIKLTPDQRESVPHLSVPFTPDLAADYDLLVGLHAHGSNLHILDACAQYHKNFAILPCCVIDEPLVKQPGINWFDSLFAHAQSLGLNPQIAALNFVGQSRVIYTKNQTDNCHLKGANAKIFATAM